MKHYYLAAIWLFCQVQPEMAWAQNLAAPCGSDYWRAKALQDPELLQKNQAYEEGILQVFKQKITSTGTPEQAKVLPVVVHIIHDNGVENISDAQVQQAITWLNQALANQGTFNQGSGADCGIQLCLAQRTPDGLPTNGITRDQSTLTEMQMESNDIQVKNLNRWKTKDYVNIWLVRSICSTTYGCGVYGYANYPYAHGTNIDGIVIEAGYVTAIGKITGLAHEMGHYLGLYHSFEGGCSNNNCLTDGDRICDTPPDQSTAGVPCGDVVSTCTTDTQSGPFSVDQSDMTWNFMDYGIIACFHDYTPDQSTRMNATLDGIRHSLLDSKGCLPPCPANTVAAFTASATTVTVGQTVSFSNSSQNASAYAWTVNGTPFSNQANPNYTFTNPGTYTVVLNAQPANAFLCDPSTASVVIQVICNVTATFTVSTLFLEVGQTVTLTNTSQNATQTEWFLNGISQGATLDSLNFSMAGTYQIKLISGNGPCQAISNVDIAVQGLCDEDHRLFQLSYGDPQSNWTDASGVVILEDGNLVFVFNSAGTGFNFDKIHLVKTTPSGQQLWTKTIGDDHVNYNAYGGLVATNDGGFAMTCSKGIATSRAIICKFSSNGDLIWMRSTPENAKLQDLVATPDGKITACGNFSFPNPTNPFFVQYDANGVLQWIRAYQVSGANSVNAMTGTPDGDFVAVGADGYLFRLSSLGTLIWYNQFLDISLSDVTVLATNEIVCCGANNDFTKAVFVIISANNIIVKAYSADPNGSFFKKMIPNQENGFTLIIENQVLSQGSIMGLDSDGNLAWTRQYLNAPGGILTDLIQYKDIGYLLAGVKFAPIGGWILKTDQKGRIGDCPSVPFPVTMTDPGPLAVTIPAIVELSPEQLVADSISITDWLVKPDTICTLACASPIEICNNNLDDDGDGLFDCLDPECNCTEDRCDPKQANIWYFGNKAGLDFNTNPPTMLADGQAVCQGISATMSDVKGNLLFYTDGQRVYNRFHQVMPNGNLQPSNLVYQCIIIPHPGNTSQFYVVINYSGGFLFYSLIDMTLDDGRGDIVATQDNLLLASVSSGLAVVKACSFQGFWLLTRTLEFESKFQAFRIDLNGINLNPISSNSGQAVGAVRQLKISPDGKSIACDYFSFSNFDSTFVSTYRFDPYTSGTVSDPMLVGEYNGFFNPMGVEFSPNGRFLYVSGAFPSNVKLVQYDLGAGNLAAIKNSKVNLAILPGQDIEYMQLAPDGKIYAPSTSGFTPPALDIIHQPNLQGIACQYENRGLFPVGPVWFGLCNVISSYYVETQTPTLSLSSLDTICVLNTPVNFQIENLQCGVDSIIWKTENLSTQIQPNFQSATIRFMTPGAGRLIVTAFTPCGSATDTLDILVVAPLNKTIDLGPDIVVCQNGVFSFNAGSGFARYQWSNGTTDSTTTTLFPGKYWVNAWDLCGNLQTDTITVSIAPGSVLDLGPDLPQQCSGFSANYQRPANFDSWQWSPNNFINCADCPSVTLSPTVSATWVVVAKTDQGCISVDTLNATIRDTLLFSRDTFVCVGQTLAILGEQLPADTTAEFFLPAPGIGCDTLLTVNVLGIENAASVLSATICPNAVYAYHGVLLPADTVAVFHLPSALSCDSVVTVKVNAYPPLNLTLPMDTTIRIGASVLLDTKATGTGTLNFAWSPPDGLSCIACPDPLANPLDTITYTLAVADINGCTAQESVTIRVNEECRVRVPNAFTPNGDGSNDRFRPIMDPCVRTVRLWRMVNRWGQTVFEQFNFAATDTGLGWDGNSEGKAQLSDVLIWVAEFEYYDGRKESKSGEVTLLR